jgi:hypothetical protein
MVGSSLPRVARARALAPAPPDPGPPRGADGARPPAPIYTELRERFLTVDPRELGFTPSADLPLLYGAMMETRYPEGVATLITQRDGTSSLYLSNGTCYIGGGHRPKIAAAAVAFVRAAQSCLDSMELSDQEDLPQLGHVTIRALGFRERRAADVPEGVLTSEVHPLHGAYAAAHTVISLFRTGDVSPRR